jgi:hypothetical protein
VAAQIVDVLESINVEAQDRNLLVPAPRPQQRLLEAVAKQNPVRQPGQRVVIRHEPDLRLGGLALGNVSDRGHAHTLPLVIHLSAEDLDRYAAAVGVQHANLVGALRTARHLAIRQLAILGGDEARDVAADHLRERLAEKARERVVAVDQTAIGVDHDALEGGVGQVLQPARLSDAAMREMLIDDRPGEAEAEQDDGDAADGEREHDRRDHALGRQRHQRARRQLERAHGREVQGADADDEQQST